MGTLGVVSVDEIVKSVATQVPALTILAVVVYSFLKFLNTVLSDHQSIMREMHRAQHEEAERNRAVQVESVRAVSDNTAALRDVQRAIEGRSKHGNK